MGRDRGRRLAGREKVFFAFLLLSAPSLASIGLASRILSPFPPHSYSIGVCKRDPARSPIGLPHLTAATLREVCALIDDATLHSTRSAHAIGRITFSARHTRYDDGTGANEEGDILASIDD